jgi:peptidoglycan/LPS O-acetylase OafA/YrhL
MKRFAYLDSLRGLAILGVLSIHTGLTQSELAAFPGWFVRATAFGQMGVQLFFLVSAFTLYHSFASRGQQETHPIRNFFVRRYFRLAPMYYLGVALFVFRRGLLPWWRGETGEATTDAVVANLLFLNGLHPTWINSVVMGGWSIGIEALFYGLVPLLFAHVNSLRRSGVWVLISLSLAAWSNVFANQAYSPAATETYLFRYLWLPSQLPSFAVGIFLYFYTQRGTPPVRYGWLVPVVLVGYLAWLATSVPFNGWPPVIGDAVPGVFAHFLFLPVFVALFWYVQRHPSRLLNNAFTRYVGTISYSLYIVHPFVLFFVENLPLESLAAPLSYGLRLALVLGTSIGIATLTYRFIEKPSIALGNRLLAPKPVPAPAESLNEN